MRILYVASQYSYGRPELGRSFEHWNFYHALVHMGHDILYFDFIDLKRRLGREAMNQRLKEVADAERPDVLFCVLHREHIDRDVMRRISASGRLPTVNWFTDDHFLFESYSRFWAPSFNWVVTTSEGALPRYASIGCKNVIKSQWGCNHFLYRRLDLPLAHDCTFIGQPHGDRRHVIGILRDAGVTVSAWGNGWENGVIGQEEMIRVFNQSRINLNLSNASGPPRKPLSALKRVRRAAHEWLSDRLNVIPGVKAYRAHARARRKERRRQRAAARSAKSPDDVVLPEQIKGRNFEVPGCCGFLLTGPAENLADYYRDGQEVVVFRSHDELVEGARYYLEHEDERAAIAEAGYRRTMEEHTYVRRFGDIFARMGLAAMPSPQEAPAARAHLGATREIT
ncbi:MAG: CgeB family protein [Planctomycetota bacterium]